MVGRLQSLLVKMARVDGVGGNTRKSLFFETPCGLLSGKLVASIAGSIPAHSFMKNAITPAQMVEARQQAKDNELDGLIEQINNELTKRFKKDQILVTSSLIPNHLKETILKEFGQHWTITISPDGMARISEKE